MHWAERESFIYKRCRFAQHAFFSSEAAGYKQNQISQYESRGVNKLNTIKVFAEFYETTVSKIIEMAEEYTPADEEDARIEQ